MNQLSHDTAIGGSADLELVQAYLLARRETALGEASEEDASQSLSFERFYAQYDPFIRRVVRSRQLPSTDAEDCVQEVWVELIRKLGGLHYDSSLGPIEAWLLTVVRRKVNQFTGSETNDRVGRDHPTTPEPDQVRHRLQRIKRKLTDVLRRERVEGFSRNRATQPLRRVNTFVGSTTRVSRFPSG